MLKRTPGKWKWIVVPEGEGIKAVIVVEDENDDNTPGMEEGLKRITPTVGDYQLATNAPEMHELLWQVSEEIDEALHQGVITEGIYRVSRKITALLAEINVEREGRP